MAAYARPPASGGGRLGEPMNQLLDSDRLAHLASLFVTPEAGTSPPDSMGYGDPLDWGAYAPYVALRQQGMPAEDVVRIMPADLRGELFQHDAGSAGVAPLTTLSAKYLLTATWPEPVWVVPELLPAGLAFLAGRPKLGKSWLALQIALGVATGGRLFDRPIERGSVLYAALEDSPRRLQDRMRKLGWPATQPGEAEFYTAERFGAELGDLGDPVAVLKLTAQIRTRGYRLVVVDTLSRSIRGDQNEAAIMTAALAPLQITAHACNCCVLVIDHHRKASGADPDAILDLGGSTAKSAVADVIWGLYREQGKAGAILHCVGRDVDDTRLKLSYDPLTRAWQCEGDADRITTGAQDAVLDAVDRLGRCGLMDVVHALGKEAAEKGHVHTRLQQLVNLGYLSRIEQGTSVLYEVV